MNLDPDWWKHAVVYQIYPRSFADSNGDGFGDLRGIIDKADYLARLGIDVVWLSPIYRSPQDDNGYDISDYRDIDPLFGTLDDLDELIDALHQRGIKLVMDLVVNHSSDEHEWFQESRDPRSPKRDWYIWRPGVEPRDLPTGWRGDEPTAMESVFSGPAWQFDEMSGEFYLHTFSKKQPDLNWENDEVRAAVYDMMRWWLERGVDGFRMDVINAISKTEDFYSPDNVVTSFNGPRVDEFLAEMHREVFDHFPDREILTVGEMPDVTPEQALVTTDPANRELNMVFQFEHVNLEDGFPNRFTTTPMNALGLRESLARWQASMGDVGWNSLYLDNHDQARYVSRWGNDEEHWQASAKAIVGMLHAHRGTPYVYQGDEIGMRNYPFASVDDMRDLESLNYIAAREADGTWDDTQFAAAARMSRDNARTPMHWDDSKHAGFTDGEPWIGVNPDFSEINVANQLDDPESIFNFYRRLIGLRHSRPCLALGDFTLRFGDDNNFWWVERRLEGEPTLIAVANCSDAPNTPPEALPEGEVLLDNGTGLETFDPWGFVLLEVGA